MSDEARDALQAVGSGGTIIFLGIAGGQAADYVARILIARQWGADVYGLINIGLAFLYIVTPICLLGLPAGVARFVALYRGSEDEWSIREILRTAFAGALPLSLLVGMVSFLSADWMARRLFDSPALTPVFQVFSVTLVMSVAFRVALAGLRGFERMKDIVLSQYIGQRGGLLLLVGVAALLGYAVEGLAAAYLASFLLGALAGASLLWRLVRRVADRPDEGEASEGRGRIRKQLFAFSWPLALSQILSDAESRVDTALLGYFADSAEVGFYNAALPTARVVLLVSSALGMVLLPAITRLYAQDERDSMRVVFRSANRWLFYGSLPLLVVLFVQPELALGVLFGGEYTSAAFTLRVLSVGLLAYLFGGLGGAVVNAVGRTRHMLVIGTLILVVNVGVGVLTIPELGRVGAALATSSSYAAMSVYVCLFIKSELGRLPFDRQWLIYFLTVAGVFLALDFLRAHVPVLADGVMGLLGALAASLLAMGAGLAVVGFEPEDWTLIRAVAQRVGLAGLLPTRE